MSTTLHKLGYRALSYLKRSSPTILTIGGAAGVVATAALTAKATPKAVHICEKLRVERKEEPTKPEYARAVWRCYIPAAAVGLATIACIFGANALSKRAQASLASAFTLLAQTYERYREAAKTVYGEDADTKIKAQVAKEIYISENGRHLYRPDLNKESDHVIFYESFSQRYFISTIAAVINAQYHLNRNYALRGEISINEYYEFLGIDKIEGGDDITWYCDDYLNDGIVWLDFENSYIKMEDGTECYYISPEYDPTPISWKE